MQNYGNFQKPINPPSDLTPVRGIERKSNFINKAIMNDESISDKSDGTNSVLSPPRPKSLAPEKTQSKEAKSLENTSKGFTVKRAIGNMVQNKKIDSPSKTVNQDALKMIFENKEFFRDEKGAFDSQKIYSFITGRNDAKGEPVKSSVNRSNYDNYITNLVSNGSKHNVTVRAQLGGAAIGGVIKAGQEPWKAISEGTIINTLTELGIDKESQRMFLDLASFDSEKISQEEALDKTYNLSDFAYKLADQKFGTTIEITSDNSLTKAEKNIKMEKKITITNLARQINDTKIYPLGFLRFQPFTSQDPLMERIYISFNPQRVDELMDIVLKEFAGKNEKKYAGISEIKICGPQNAGSKDGIIIYVNGKEHKEAEKVRNEAIKFLKNLKSKSPDLFADANHPYKTQHASGIASVTVEGDSSYSELAAKKIAEELNGLGEVDVDANLNFKNLNKQILSKIEISMNEMRA